MTDTATLAPTVIRHDAELSTKTRGDLKAKLFAAFDAGKHVILDLSPVGYIDSSGLGALLAATRHADMRKVQFILCGLNEDLRTLLELTKMDSVFTLAADVEQARALFPH